MPSPPPWPVLHELNERYHVGALPADDESGLVLYPAEGLLRSEKEAALRYAKDDPRFKGRDMSVKHPLMPEGTPNWLKLLDGNNVPPRFNPDKK